MTIARLKCTAIAAALLLGGASAQADTLINEGFESFATLGANGWLLLNSGALPGTTSLAQGDVSIFPAQSGSPESYVSGNYNNATVGGYINSWLITPQFSTAAAGTITFWARADIAPGYSDKLAYGISNAVSGDFASGSLSAPITLTGTWTPITLNFAARGAGTVARFAMVYTGLADTSNYIGIDSVSVVNAVPEPTSWLMLGAGLMGLSILRRRATANR
jgi:hypothetical protein